MDVYIGFGLLTAGIVVLVFMIVDSWFKNRSRQMARRSSGYDKTQDYSGFNANSDENELVELHGSDENFDKSSEHYADGEQIEFAELYDDGVSLGAPSVSSSSWTQKTFDDMVSEKKSSVPSHLLIASVMAKPGSRFESYDLLQAIATAGLQFGEMSIFHYYQMTPAGKVALFSLASANKPGDFDLNNMAEFSCTGLMLFMDIGKVPDPQYAFKLMLDTAEHLAEDLDGNLCADPATPWNEKLAWQYHQKIMQYKAATKHAKTTYA